MVLAQDQSLPEKHFKGNEGAINLNKPVVARRGVSLRIITLALAYSFALFFWRYQHPSLPSYFDPSRKNARPRVSTPAEEWHDDWPYHEQEPWDISTDFPYPRTLEYEVEEGTWLRLDVHPKSGEIVFDMLGDLYCLSPGSTQAHPILFGIPHDADPHFSPKGDLLAFRSDAELGLDNIWVTPWTGCDEAALRPHEELQRKGVAPRQELLDALASQKHDEHLLNSGVKESAGRRRRRLVREGRSNAWRVTNETYRTVSEPRFHPDGQSIIAVKWYTSSRSLGAGEGWQYDIRTPEDRISVGSGKRIVERVLPSGWTKEQYGDQQIGSEQFIWRGTDSLIYSKRIEQEGSGVFSYSGDIHSGLYGIFARNLTTGDTETLVSSFPGSASRPELSRDGSTLAFVRRIRDKEALALMNLRSGTLRYIWYGLTYDATSITAPMGTYPTFAFTPNDDAVIIWAAGKIWSIPLTKDSRGEKVLAGEPKIVPFKAKIEKRLAETWRPSTDLRQVELAEKQRVHAFKELSADSAGKHVVFQAAGVTFVQEVDSSSNAIRVPVLDPTATYYSPSFIPNTSQSVVHAKWSETNFTSLELADLETKTVYPITGLPIGRYILPTVSGGGSLNRKLAFVRLGGDLLTGDILETRGTGIYVGDISLPQSDAENDSSSIAIQNVQQIPSDVALWDVASLRLRFTRGSDVLLVQQHGRDFVIDLASGPNEFGQFAQEILVTAKTASEVAISPVLSSDPFKNSQSAVQHVAFVDFLQVFHVSGNNLDGKPLRSKPGDSTPGVQKVSLDGGHDLAWSGDGKRLFWFLGPYLHYVNVDALSIESASTKWQEIEVYYDSDIARLKQELSVAVQAAKGLSLDFEGSDVVAIVNASILTMENGVFGKDFISNGALTFKDGAISSVGTSDSIEIPPGAHVIDAAGGLIVPGFIDVHAHWGGFSVQIPTKSWELETFLAYGVTTLHNPSSDSRDGYHERYLVESGKMIGPRIYHTGNVIYGAGLAEIHQDVVNLEEAKSALVRIRVEGGPSSFSYKNYNLPSRASRQRLLLAARNQSMFSVPEGGMNLDWDLTYIIDGMATVEHAIPIPVLHDDILTLYVSSGTATTPTHIVNYGGVMGEQLLWATHDIVNDPKLRRFTRHDILEGHEETTKRPLDSFAFFNTSASVAKLVHRGAWANIGAHGEPPLGLMYHAEMHFTMAGGLDAYEVFRAATRDGALSLGLFESIGSITPGKLADLVVYPPGVDFGSLRDLTASKDIQRVIKGGRVFDANTMTEEWPMKGRKQVLPIINAD
ncbi:hypothetical protein M422DRAFT_67773 [Sphaerobolus stellatus SS14]|uniref:Amidohydrolase-related domain-containing protein n=1 Tax=Sphaerobolus stellatus (strain SS14) TaxID=990650 RepID=A0A0C9UM73_SPHS4|nr:hypothetical protein M422DRAFT_67773 [Sphaerobolus stellatus SS14]